MAGVERDELRPIDAGTASKGLLCQACSVSDLSLTLNPPEATICVGDSGRALSGQPTAFDTGAILVILRGGSVQVMAPFHSFKPYVSVEDMLSGAYPGLFSDAPFKPPKAPMSKVFEKGHSDTQVKDKANWVLRASSFNCPLSCYWKQAHSLFFQEHPSLATECFNETSLRQVLLLATFGCELRIVFHVGQFFATDVIYSYGRQPMERPSRTNGWLSTGTEKSHSAFDP